RFHSSFPQRFLVLQYSQSPDLLHFQKGHLSVLTGCHLSLKRQHVHPATIVKVRAVSQQSPDPLNQAQQLQVLLRHRNRSHRYRTNRHHCRRYSHLLHQSPRHRCFHLRRRSRHRRCFRLRCRSRHPHRFRRRRRSHHPHRFRRCRRS